MHIMLHARIGTHRINDRTVHVAMADIRRTHIQQMRRELGIIGIVAVGHGHGQVVRERLRCETIPSHITVEHDRELLREFLHVY